MAKKFQKNVESFVCEKCGHFVEGTGFTNHCPKCLWSKHVDINPGDRAGKCTGLMEPVAVEKSGREYSLIHKCVNCGERKKNRVSPEDDFEKVVETAKKAASKAG